VSGFSTGLACKSGERGAAIPSSGHFVTRLPEQLQLHPTLTELGCPLLDEMNEAARQKSQSIAEPILITTNGTILAGFGLWRLAVLQCTQAVQCIEYPIGGDDSLQFILRYHQPRRSWNAYLRIRMALTLEPQLQQQALKNMRNGGKYKGLANLPNLYRIDVREEIGALAGVSPRLVGNVKTIQQAAHSCVLEALRNGALKINGAMALCKLPKAQSLARGSRNQPGGPAVNSSAGDEKSRHCRSTRSFASAGGPTAGISSGP